MIVQPLKKTFVTRINACHLLRPKKSHLLSLGFINIINKVKNQFTHDKDYLEVSDEETKDESGEPRH